MTELAPDECDLCGEWLVQKDPSVIADATGQRIEWLPNQKLQRIETDSSGCQMLIRDPRDGRLWELTYPQSEIHGGGARRFHVISRDEAATEYSHAST